MSYQDIIENIADKSQISRIQTEKFLKSFINTVNEELIKNQRIKVKSLGVFQIKDRFGTRMPVLTFNRYFRNEISKNITSAMAQNKTVYAPQEHIIPIQQQTKPQKTKPQPIKKSFFDTLLGRKPATQNPNPVSTVPNPQTNKAPNTPPRPQETKPTSPPTPAKPAFEGKIPENFQRIQKDIITALKQPSQQAKISYIDLKNKKIPKEILSKVPEYIARLYQAVPLEEKNGKLVLAMVDPEDYQALEFIKKKTGQEIKPVLATQDDIAHILDQYGETSSELTKNLEDVEEHEKESKKGEKSKTLEEEITKTEAPTSRAVHLILKKAVMAGASDVHIESYEKEVAVRFRIDGVLQKILTLPKSIQPAIISRIKILANMKIDETRLPQDGRFEMVLNKKKIDFRTSVFPTVYGEKAVMRILDKSTGIIGLEKLGVRNEAYNALNDNINKSHGMILVTGPTGSGKTTTLYAVLDKLNVVGVNIVTLEDPVEYQIQGINQGQIKSDIGFSFAKGLRSILRQDPDVVMVGEIRDLETAEMAVHAALTGHVVLSTLHTNNAAGAIPRLIDMGIEPFLITSSINAVIAQRLTRKICEECREKTTLDEVVLKEIQAEIAEMPAGPMKRAQTKGLVFYKGKGCAVCNNSGYKGRMGIYEIFPVSESIKALAIKKVSGSVLEQKAIEEGMITMKKDGILKALDGITTIEEVWRVTRE